MTTVISIIVLIVIGKFIYDSYITNNTNERWVEHKSIIKASERNKIEDEIDLGFNELTRMFYEINKLNQSNNIYRSKIIKVQEALEYHLIHFEYVLEELEGLLYSNNKENITKYIKIRNHNLVELSNYNRDYDVDGALYTSKINRFLDKLNSLDKLMQPLIVSKEKKMSKNDFMNILRNVPFINEGINHNIVISKVEFNNFSGEALVTFHLMNVYCKKKAESHFSSGEYDNAVDALMKKYVSNELGIKLDKFKLASVYGILDYDDIVIGDVIPQSEII